MDLRMKISHVQGKDGSEYICNGVEHPEEFNNREIVLYRLLKRVFFGQPEVLRNRSCPSQGSVILSSGSL